MFARLVKEKLQKGEFYDYSAGYSATFKDENGEPKRIYYQFRLHLVCEEEQMYIDNAIEFNLPF